MSAVPREVGPFPWQSLPRATRPTRAVSAVEQLIATGTRHPLFAAITAELSALAGTPVGIRLRNVLPISRASRTDRRAVTVVLENDAGDACVWLEAEGTLAAILSARVFKRSLRSIRLDPLAPPSEDVCGAFAAVLLSVLRKNLANAQLPWLVAAAGPAQAMMMEAALANAAVASFTVTVDDEAFLVRVAFTEEAARSLTTGSSAWDVDRLGDAKLALSIVGCVTSMTTRDVAELVPGAAWLPESLPFHRAGHGNIAGPVVLAAPRSEQGVRATLGEDGRLVVGASVEDLSMSHEERALIDNVGEVPVVVRIEIGAVEMPAREWAKLRPGDVIATGRRIGESVSLRVSGVELARGELVELEGEIGIRILGSDTATHTATESR